MCWRSMLRSRFSVKVAGAFQGFCSDDRLALSDAVYHVAQPERQRRGARLALRSAAPSMSSRIIV
jgi:hypothetical protein